MLLFSSLSMIAARAAKCRRCLLLLCVPLSATAQETLDAQMQRAHAQSATPVLAWATLERRGSTWHRRGDVLGAAEATPLRWGSITKTVTALTVLRVAAARSIDISDPLARHVTARHWTNPWHAQQPLRLLHLLELTAGLPDLSGREFDHNTPVTLAEALALAPERRTLLWPPGTHHSYSNLVPGLSQLFVETVTGDTYAAAATRHVLTPLGMRGAFFTPHAGFRSPPLPGGFQADGATPIPYWHMTFPAYGALNAPLDALVKLLSHLADTRSPALLPAERQRLFTPATTLGARRDFGFSYAAGLYPRVRRGFVWWTHGGDADGYRSRLALLPGHDRGYVVAINVDDPGLLRRLERRLEAHLVKALQPPPPPAAPGLDPGTLAALSGTYYPATTRFRVDPWQSGDLKVATVAPGADGSHLVFRRGSRAQALLPVTDRQFRRPDDPVATVVFVADGEQLYLQGELGNFRRVDKAAVAGAEKR